MVARLLLPAGVFLGSTPLVFLAGVWQTLPEPRKPRRLGSYVWSFPFCGGPRTLVFQAIAWVFWLCSVLVALPALGARWRQGHDSAHMELLGAAAVVGAVFSLLFQLKSLLSFDPAKPLRLWSGLVRGGEDIAWDVRRLPSKFSASYVVAGMGLVWSMMGGALLLATEHFADATSRLVYYALSGACFTVATFTTHGLAGYLRYSQPEPASSAASSGSSASASSRTSSPSKGGSRGSAGDNGLEEGGDSRGWRFWQPFKGGTLFVATQALGWMLYSSALVSILALIYQAVLGVAYCMRCWAVAAGAVMVASELLLAGSLSLFKAPASVEGLTKQGLGTWLRDFAVICALYIPMHMFCAAMGLTYRLLPAAYATTLWAGGLFVYYMLTSFGEPEHTGRREWPRLQHWFGRALESALPAWLGSFEVLRDAKAEAFDPSKRYIFGFVHHGLYPLGAGYIHNTPSFRAHFPKLRFVTLGASVINFVPIIRDIGHWLGLRVIKRRTFVAALREGRSVVMVPGGQAEMVLTYRMFNKQQPEYAVYTRHKGFVRIAIEEGASLVPLVALGEINSLGNLVDWPALQRYTYKRIGFPIPYLIAGKWGFLPLPAKTGLRFVVGEPIQPPQLAKGQEHPTQEQIDALHAQFYAAVEALWHKHREGFPGYERVKLVME